MNITLGKPLAVSDKGRRGNNEDSIFPLSEIVSSGDSWRADNASSLTICI